MKILNLPKKNLLKFVESLKEFGEVNAPIKKGSNSFAFDRIKEFKKINLNYTRTILPLKKYFLKPISPMFKFTTTEGYIPIIEDEDKRNVFFGIHSCDIKSLEILDMAMKENYVDERYFNIRNNSAIIGISCEPDEYCFCHSMQADFVESGFELFLSELDNSYLVTVKTSLGDDMIMASASLFEEVTSDMIEKFKNKADERLRSFSNQINISYLPEIIELDYKSDIWKKYSDKCLSCGSCTMVCTTCYCYDVYDEITLNGKQGKRLKRWDSCFFPDYALVAGGENFREERFSRFRYRYLHKQEGFVSKYGRPSCTGCGRCIDVCPAGIDLRKVIQKIRGEV